jgi:serine phosphatase RsbU (regulator of sigma subunit)/FixJ family two-component response regulator
MSDDVDDLLFASDDGAPDRREELIDPGLSPWKVLIVDDDESVHSITRVVLDKLAYRKRPIQLISAYSGREAWRILKQEPDVAVILLDVVMEREDAGLRLVRRVRDELANKRVQIILRTGQPGQAPEREVILAYDLYDYKAKTELTAQKLFTATVSALRSYDTIVALDNHRRSLEQILDASSLALRERGLLSYAKLALRAFRELLGHDGESLLCGRRHDPSGRRPRPVYCLAGEGAFGQVATGLPLAKVAPPKLIEAIEATLANATDIDAADFRTCFVRTPSGHEGVVYLSGNSRNERAAPALLRLFLQRMSEGFDNVWLRDQLQHHQSVLELQIAQRTRALTEANAALLSAQHQVNEELAAAQALQQAILPPKFPKSPCYEGFGMMRAARQVGGDFYDVFMLNEHLLGLVIADTCGKGVPAAIYMAMAQTILRAVATAEVAPADVLRETNRLLEAQNPMQMFVTVFYGVLDVRSGELRYATGGHDGPLVRRADGSVDKLTSVRGLVLGIVDRFDFGQGMVRLAEGDTLLLFTDGITEGVSVDGEMFGEERLVRYLAEGGDKPIELLVGDLVSSTERFAGTGRQADDITCVGLRYLGPIADWQNQEHAFQDASGS